MVKTVWKISFPDEERITRQFRNVHALAKNNRPFSDFKWMNDLDRAKGLDVQDRYDNAKYGKVFPSYIAKNPTICPFQNAKNTLRSRYFFCINIMISILKQIRRQR